MNIKTLNKNETDKILEQDQEIENDNGKIQYLESLIKDMDKHIEILKEKLIQRDEELDDFRNHNSELSNNINDLTDENQAFKDVISYMAIEKYGC